MSTTRTFRRAANFAKAVVRHARDGFVVLSDEEVTERLAVCTGESAETGISDEPCEYLDDSKSAPRCLHSGCGCWLRTKAAWRSETCPLGKWPTPS